MGVHVPASPGFSGWTRLNNGTWKTMNAGEIRECARALKADIAECGCKDSLGPLHSTTYIHGDQPASKAAAHSYKCRSGSRWFNPVTRLMEGRKHCTCDSCY